MKEINRRNFIKTAGIFLAGGLAFPRISEVKTNESKLIKKIFEKDTDQILLARMIFGEGGGVSNSEKITIGFTPINRAKDNKEYTGRTIKEAILKSKPKEIKFKNGKERTIIVHQYSCFNSWDKNLKKVINPYAYEPKEWIKCLKISRDILEGKYDKYNFGPTHYHVKGIKPRWAKRMEKLDSTGFKHQFYREA